MRRQAKHQKRTVKLRYLIYLVLVTSVISSTTLARFVLKENSAVGATIAAFASGSTLSLDLGALEGLTPGTKLNEEITFTVTNYTNDGTVCEVPVNYEMQIETTGNLPLNFTLEGRVTAGPEDESLSKTVGALENQTTLLAKGGKLPSARSGGKASHTYTLKIEWPEDKTAEGYSNEIDHLSVRIKTEQAAIGD